MSKLRFISWNMKQKESNWQIVLDSEVDAAMLQEAKQPPSAMKDSFIVDREGEWTEPGLSWRAAVAGLKPLEKIDFTPINTQPIGANNPEALMISQPGSLAAAYVRIKDTGEKIIIVSMYATWMTPIRQTGSRWIFADASAHRLISDLCGLIGREKGHKIIAAGDLNIFHGYGEGGNLYWKGRYETVFERMAVLGMHFVGPQAPFGGRQAEPWPDELPVDSRNVPTFYHNKQRLETATRQLDYVFASESLTDRIKVKALNSVEEWGPSDHCRILIEVET
ncbi:MAG: hypothetical protein SCJ94_10560 [Bacillota bacterium]|nr:hypothetical protein [Bacillota bacterium]